MRRGGFTLIELIFVIVVIGILAAVAIPKYKNLKQHAEASAVVKTTIDGAQSAANAAINLLDLENNNSFELKDIVSLKGKGWIYTANNYSFKSGNNVVASITLNTTNRQVTYTIDCTKFSDGTTQEKCKKLIGDGTISNVTETIEF